MTVLVTGATGFIGLHLVKRLINTGCEVRVLTRGTTPVPSDWTSRVDVVVGNLLDKRCVQSAVKGMTTVVNLAGVIMDHSRLREINVEGARLLTEASAWAGVLRLVHVSSAGVVGVPTTEVVTEDTPCHPLTPYEWSKYEGEQAVLAVASASSLDAVILRPTTVFGEGLRSGKDSLLEWARIVQRGRFVFFGQGGVANYVYAGDVAEAICQVAAGPSRGPALYFVADSTSLENFVAAMADAAGVPLLTSRMPVWVAYVGAGVLGIGHALFGLPAPLTFGRVRALTYRHCYAGDRLRRTYPAFKSVGYRVGLRETLQWYRDMEIL